MFSTGKSHVPGLTDFTEVLVGQVVGVDRDTLYMLPHTAWERCEEGGGGEEGREGERTMGESWRKVGRHEQAPAGQSESALPAAVTLHHEAVIVCVVTDTARDVVAVILLVLFSPTPRALAPRSQGTCSVHTRSACKVRNGV